MLGGDGVIGILQMTELLGERIDDLLAMLICPRVMAPNVTSAFLLSNNGMRDRRIVCHRPEHVEDFPIFIGDNNKER